MTNVERRQNNFILNLVKSRIFGYEIHGIDRCEHGRSMAVWYHSPPRTNRLMMFFKGFFWTRHVVLS